jgi:hypothetical protein
MIKLIQKIFLGCFMGFVSVGCSVFGVGSEERPSYEVILKDRDKEIRKYESYIIAKTTITGSFKEAQREGFKILAGYIFGKNQSRQKIPMTSPVVQKRESEKISMTAPVVLEENENKTWTMTFSMPSQYTLENLPVPNDDRITIEKVDQRYVAALRYSGLWTESKNAQKGRELEDWMKNHQQFELDSKPMFAGYNPPWTIPFFRRNEALIELKKK